MIDSRRRLTGIRYSSSSSSSSAAPQEVSGNKSGATTSTSTTKSTVKQQSDQTMALFRRPVLQRLLGSYPKTKLVALGMTVCTLSTFLWAHSPDDDDDDEHGTKQAGWSPFSFKAPTKQVLVLPFDQLELMEDVRRYRQSPQGILSTLSNSDSPTKPVAMGVDELVSLLHNAASDDSIVAVYGKVGSSASQHHISQLGWGHLEEIRRALQVVQESHRYHLEPNYDHSSLRPSPRQAKPMLAYASTFGSPTGSTKSYYIASAFTQMALQPQGDLNLFGAHVSQLFYKDLLEHQLGIRLDVWRCHSAYKTFPNKFIKKQFTKQHAQQTKNLLQEIQNHVGRIIYHRNRKDPLAAALGHSIYSSSHNKKGSRWSSTKKQQSSMEDHLKMNEPNDEECFSFWKMVHAAGSFPATIAQQVGFVDRLPLRDPLDAWKKELSSKEKVTTLSIVDYAQQQARHNQQKERKAIWRQRFSLSNWTKTKEDDDDETQSENGEEKIVVLKINGPIMDATATRMEHALRQLRKDKSIKALVLRIDSPGGSVTACETIHQELQDLPQKVIVSYGNVSASGGYYISANVDRIFCLPTTITGSIGVFLARMDIRGLLNKYGVTVDSISTSELSGSFDPCVPLHRHMDENFSNIADRSYLHFKRLVSEGRGLDMDSVQEVAQGKVWTGTQAKELGLVDELGGLDRAIAYTQRTHTTTGKAQVVSWPPHKSGWKNILLKNQAAATSTDGFLASFGMAGQVLPLCWLWNNIVGTGPESIPSISSSSGATDDNPMAALNLPAASTGVLLTIDEDTAVRCMIQQSRIPSSLLFPSSN